MEKHDLNKAFNQGPEKSSAENLPYQAEEWFAKYYQGEKKEKLPSLLLENNDEEKIDRLIAKYQEKNQEKKNNNGQQIEIDFPE